MRAAHAGCAALLVLCGCGGDARVELSAGDALLAVANQMERTVQEYHQEVNDYDDARETAVVNAFVARVRKDAADGTLVEGHAAEFTQALAHIRSDRETESGRKSAAMENVSALREVSQGLQKLAIQSLSLQDEWKRYLTSWVEAKQRKEAAAAKSAGAAAESKS